MYDSASGAYEPGSHALQLAAPAGAHVPAGHAAHSAMAASRCVPAPHGVQSCMRLLQTWPSGQAFFGGRRSEGCEHADA